MKKVVLLLFLNSFVLGMAQVGVNSDASSPDASAMLDVKSTTKGLLIPRMSVADRDNIASPATGLIVYVTDDNRFYYFDGTTWVQMQNSGKSWLLNGNAGTTGVEFLGTTDAQALIFKTNNTERIQINSDGNVGVNVAPDNDKRFFVESSTDDYIGYFRSTKTTTDDVAVAGVVNNTDWWGIGGYFSGGYKAIIAEVNPTGNDVYYGLDLSVNGGSGINYGVRSIVSGTGDNYAVYGRTDTDYDKGSAGFFINENSSGTGIYALGSGVTTYYLPSTGAGLAATGDLLGIGGYTDVNDDSAVCVEGVYQGTTKTNATGVYGYSAPKPNKSKGFGVKGIGGKYGVYGEATNTNHNSYAVFANGDMSASGAKPFCIDYPLDPGNKYLKHFSIESNEVLNVYRGVATLDATGYAKVDLPVYFKEINKNFSYSLTPIGQPAIGLFISKEIKNNNSFQIAGGHPGQKISWVVYAERNDPYLKQYPQKRKNIIDKDDDEKGKYLMPELYGKNDSYRLIPINKTTKLKKQKVKISANKKKK